MMKLWFRIFLLVALSTSGLVASAGSAEQQFLVKVGVLENDSPAAMKRFSGNPGGIGYELASNIMNDLPIRPEYIYFKGRRDATEAIKKNQIQVLVGAFEESPELAAYNIGYTTPYFIDELAVTTIRKGIEMDEILSLIFNDLFLITLGGALLTGLVVASLLFFIEKDRHPHLKDSSTFEQFSYSMFTVYSCFFRDLLYDPVTSAGRILFGVWIILSVFVITILGALVTSSVLHLMNHSGHSIHRIDNLRGSRTGILYGQARLESLLQKTGVKTEVFNNITEMVDALKNKKLDNIATSRSNLQEYYNTFPDQSKSLVTSQVTLGYEAWTLYLNKYYGNIVFGRPLIDIYNDKINKYRNDFRLHTICSHYIADPSHCVF